jgi:hypothetical protein
VIKGPGGRAGRITLFFLLFSLFAPDGAAPAEAHDIPSAGLEDDTPLRIELRDPWFVETPEKVLAHRPVTKNLRGGSRVQVRVESAGEEFTIVLAREWKGSRAELDYIAARTGSSWPGWTQGSWSLTRLRNGGAPLRIRVFLRSDPNIYIQFRPFSRDKCLMDVVLYEAYVVQSLPLGIPFEGLYITPLEEVLSLGERKFPRKYFDVVPQMYRDQREFIKQVRARLPSLNFRDDGAMDEGGNYVFINSLKAQEGEPGLNCSGFAKWMVDGILRPVTGKRLPVESLKKPFYGRGSSFTEPYEELRDPFFGLDWTRNLAGIAGTILRSPDFAALEETEVRDWPFADLIHRSREGRTVLPYPGFLLNAGFGFEGLQPLLYTLAVNEPGYIYLASVNRDLSGPPNRGPYRTLTMRQHFHIAVLVPYFNEYGNFRVAVFESAEETSFAAFRSRYPGALVNLVRIPVEGAFDP